jgi:class 3 adenylate cyclase/alpha-beta hydrolase superfamily lysophospholipase
VDYEASPVRYAKNGDIHIAYRVFGDAPIDLIHVAGAITHLNLDWEEPSYRRFSERLAGFARLITFDKRGMGMSDRVAAGTLEERMEDATAVLNAAGSSSAALLGVSEGGPMAMLFAAAHPERARALILCGAEVRERKDEEWPWGESTPEEFEEAMASLPERWGHTNPVAYYMPSHKDDERTVRLAQRQRMEAASPGAAMAFMRMAFDIDVRDVASSIRVPTLIIHSPKDQVCHIENARFLARTIPGAKYLEIDALDHVPWGDGADRIVPEIQEFLTGVRGPLNVDTILATVLFTDIVGSSEIAARLGDERWRQTLQGHQAAMRKLLSAYGGREIDNAGDGFLAAFDGPGRAIKCALAAVAAERDAGLVIRAGVHTGECEVLGDKLSGVAVHIGARIAALAAGGEVLVSRTVKDLVAGSRIELAVRGSASLKGIPGQWDIYAATGA